MAGNDKTLRETLNEVVGETISQNKETKEGISKSQSGETQSGGTPEYVSGVDISKYPEQERPIVRKALEEKAGLLEKGYQPKFQEVAALKKSLEWLASKGVTAEKAEKVILSALEAEKSTATTQQKKDKRTLDKLIEDSPYEQKQALENMRTIVREESSVEEVEKLRGEVSELKKTLGYLQSKDFQTLETKFDTDLKSLEGKIDKGFIERNKDAIRDVWSKNPNAPLNVIAHSINPDEYEQALLSKGSRNKEKLNAVTNNGTGVTSSTATLDVRKSSYKDILHSIIKK